MTASRPSSAWGVPQPPIGVSYKASTCKDSVSEGGLEHADAGNLPGSGKSCRQNTGQRAAHAESITRYSPCPRGLWPVVHVLARETSAIIGGTGSGMTAQVFLIDGTLRVPIYP